MRSLSPSPIFIVIAVVTLLSMSCSEATTFKGTHLNPSKVAPAFHLHDQFANAVSLSNLLGNVVVLTFLYTNCTDICPTITGTLNQLHKDLGDNANEVRILAISVDPTGDSSKQAYSYSEKRDMLDKWSFLVGTEETLAPVWSAYYVAAQREDSVGIGGALDQLNRSNPSADVNPQELGVLITHSSAVYIIDRKGYLRVLFTNVSIDPEPLLHDILILL